MVTLHAVVFDLDDTLLAATRARLRANRILRELGIHPLRWRAVGDAWWLRYVRGEISGDELRHGRWHALGLDGEAAVAADTAWRAVAFDSQFRVGARRLLAHVREAGLRTAILTNGTIDPQRRKVEKHGLAALVDLVVVTEEIGVHKPDPRAFGHVVAGLAVRAGDAAMVGDDLRADVDGSLAAGFRQAVWLARPPITSHPDPRVTVVNGPRHVPTALGLVGR